MDNLYTKPLEQIKELEQEIAFHMKIIKDKKEQQRFLTKAVEALYLLEFGQHQDNGGSCTRCGVSLG